MELVTVGSKYQIVIPKNVRKKVNGIRPGNKVGVYTEGDRITVEPAPKSWVDRNRGLMRQAWKGIDTTKYLKELRNEWERKY